MMRKITLLSIWMLLMCSIQMVAQSAAVQKAAKAVFTLTTFRADGSILASSHGVFLNFDGTAVGPLAPFQGAAKATIVDANGNSSPVDVILAFNELYNMAKFKINGNAPAICKIAAKPGMQDESAWLIPYSIQKPEIRKIGIKNIEKFAEKYNYYIFDLQSFASTEGCPIVNANAEILGLRASTSNGEVHAADLNFLETQKLTGLSINDPCLSGCGIRVALPDDEQQSELTMLVAKSKYTTADYKKYVEEFIRKYPTSVTGYQERAELEAQEGKTGEADMWMGKAMGKVGDKALAHSAYATLIYKYMLNRKDTTSFTKWTYDQALKEAEEAYKLNKIPGYLHQQGQIHYTKGNFEKACDIFLQLTKTSLRNPELFYEAAQCKSRMKDETAANALLDSTIERFPKNGLNAPYFFIRGQIKDSKGLYREAIKDYNDYDTLMLNRASHNFYYIRYQCEIKLHWWKQALNDIAHAIYLQQDEPTYYAELASLELRIAKPKEAQDAAEKCVSLAPNYTDGYIFLGLAKIQNGDKPGGLEALNKAKELGDSRAQALIDKNK